jgi:hypothetical protein
MDIIVTNNADSGNGTLRQAIQSNASLGGGNRILFSSSIAGTITLTTGEILIDHAVAIAGRGAVPGPTAAGITVSGNNATRVFHLTGGSIVTISSLTIANGNSGDQGGGIYNDFGCTLGLSNCTVSANASGNNGGGLANNGSVTAYNCTFSDNGAAFTGGGIYNYAGPVVLRNCTVVSNSAADSGGGLCNYSLAAGTSNYLSSTLVAGNSAGSGHADVVGRLTSGGYNLIGQMDYSTPSSGPVAGVPNGGLTNGINHDLAGAAASPINALIGPLQNNGGPTFTHALKPSSPAVDHGQSSGQTTDQRGAPRPYDFAAIPNPGGGDACDIGAFEISPPLDLDFTGGRTWTALGPFPIQNGQTIVRADPVSGRVTAIAVHPTNPNIVYAGTAQGGVYRTLDGGANWTQLMDTAFAGAIGTPLAAGAIAIDPTNPSNVLVGTGEGDLSDDSFFGTGFYIITNADGLTPVVNGPYNLAASDNADIFTGGSIVSIAVDPANHNNVFCATTYGFGGIVSAIYPGIPERGLYRCTNTFAGIDKTGTPAWTRLNLSLAGINTGATAVVVDPSNANNLVCALRVLSGTEGGIYRSINALAATPTFSRTKFVASFINVKLAINKVGSIVTVYATTSENAPSASAQGKLYKSVDGGATFGAALAAADGFAGAEGSYTIALGLDPANANHVYIGGASGNTFEYSTDGGTSFTSSATGLHSDAHVIAVSASNPSVIYHGNEGGIWKSAGFGLNWTSLNNTSFSATLFQGLALHPTDRNFSIGGANRNGTVFFRPDGTWTRADFGDCGTALIDQNATDTTTVTMYHTYYNQQAVLIGTARVLSASSASDGNWAFRGAPGNGISLLDAANYYAPQALGPGNPNRWYFGTDKLYRSINHADTATAVSQALQSSVPISAIAISPQDDNVRLAGLNNGKVFATISGSSTLIQIAGAGSTVGTTTTPAAGVGRIVVDPNNKAVAYVAFCGYGTPAAPLTHVWKTANLNSLPAGPVIFTRMSDGLPDIPANALAIDSMTRSAGKNSTGIYVGTDAGVYHSSDGGTNWAVYGSGFPHCAVFGLEIQNLHRLIRAATHGRGLYETFTDLQLKFTAVTRLPNGHIRLQGLGAAGQSYTIQASPDLSAGGFVSLGPVTADPTGAIDYDDPAPSGLSRRFYRISYP